jgi:2-phosphosulfolactate phosphatase
VRLEVAFLPRDVSTPDRRVCVVLDVLRASSTLVTLLERGAAPLCVAGTVDAARALAASLPAGALLCGEVGGLPPPGFDHGNSPTEMTGLALGCRAVVLATSNGTRALAALAPAPAVLVGCFLNASAVVARSLTLAHSLGADLTLVCSGDANGSQFSLEDALAAGCLVERALAQAGAPPADEAPTDRGVTTADQVPSYGGARITDKALAYGDAEALELDDGARAAWRLWQSYAATVPPTEAVARGFAESVHGRDLARLGFDADLAYCARVDASQAVPRLAVDGDRLVLRAADN